MRLRKIELPTDLRCVEGPDTVHAGPLYDMGPVTICERHLLVLGRNIADVLAVSHGLTLLEGVRRHDDAREVTLEERGIASDGSPLRGVPGTGQADDLYDGNGWRIQLNGIPMTYKEFQRALDAYAKQVETKTEPEEQPEAKPFTWG